MKTKKTSSYRSRMCFSLSTIWCIPSTWKNFRISPTFWIECSTMPKIRKSLSWCFLNGEFFLRLFCVFSCISLANQWTVGGSMSRLWKIESSNQTKIVSTQKTSSNWTIQTIIQKNSSQLSLMVYDWCAYLIISHQPKRTSSFVISVIT